LTLAAGQALSLAALPAGRTTHVGRVVWLPAQSDGTTLVIPV